MRDVGVTNVAGRAKFTRSGSSSCCDPDSVIVATFLPICLVVNSTHNVHDRERISPLPPPHRSHPFVVETVWTFDVKLYSIWRRYPISNAHGATEDPAYPASRTISRSIRIHQVFGTNGQILAGLQNLGGIPPFFSSPPSLASVSLAVVSDLVDTSPASNRFLSSMTHGWIQEHVRSLGKAKPWSFTRIRACSDTTHLELISLSPVARRSYPLSLGRSFASCSYLEIVATLHA